MPDATPISGTDIAASRANLADSDSGRDPLAPGGIPPELGDRMLKNAEELTQRQDKYMRDEAAAYKNLPAVPTVENKKLGKVPPAPQNNIKDDALLWLGFASALGGIAGAMTKRSSMNALAAFGGALDGLQQGNQTKFENDFKTWEANAKATQENNKAEMDGYRNILERTDLDHRQRGDQLEMWATQNRNKFMIELARAAKERGDFTIFTSALDSMGVQAQKGNSGLTNILESREQARVARENRLEEIRLQGENQIAAARARAEARQPLESEESLASIAQRKYEGDPSAGRYLTGENRSRFDEIFNQVLNEPGHSRDDYIKNQQAYVGGTSYQRTAGTQAARVESASNEVAQFIPQALAASDALPRGAFVPWNELVQKYQAGTSDLAYNDFVTANFSLKNAYHRAMNPQGLPRVADAVEARFNGILNQATSPQAYEVQLRRIWLEVQGVKRGTAATRGEIPEPPDPFSGRPNPLDRTQPRGGAGGADPLTQRLRGYVSAARKEGHSDADIKTFVLEQARANGWTEDQLKAALPRIMGNGNSPGTVGPNSPTTVGPRT